MLWLTYVDYGIWTLAEITSHKWHRNFSEPRTAEFQALKIEFEREVKCNKYLPGIFHSLKALIYSSTGSFWKRRFQKKIAQQIPVLSSTSAALL